MQFSSIQAVVFSSHNFARLPSQSLKALRLNSPHLYHHLRTASQISFHIVGHLHFCIAVQPSRILCFLIHVFPLEFILIFYSTLHSRFLQIAAFPQVLPFRYNLFPATFRCVGTCSKADHCSHFVSWYKYSTTNSVSCRHPTRYPA